MSQGVILLCWTLFCGVWADFDDFQKAMLEEHNKLREFYQAPPLSLDAELSENARIEAERKLNDYIELWKFTPNPEDIEERNYNDNTWAYVSFARPVLNATKIVGEWAKQAEHYDWNKNYFDPSTGHFSQIIWRSTEDLGVGKALGRSKKKHHIAVVVLRYSPPGNILDEDTFKENVFRPKNMTKP